MFPNISNNFRISELLQHTLLQTPPCME